MPGPPPGYYGVLLHGLDYQSAALGRMFSGGNQAAVASALPAGLTASYTGGLVLYNPLTSGVNVSIRRAGFVLVAAQTNAAAIGLGVGSGAPTGTLTAVASQNAQVGGTTTAAALLYSSATITLAAAPYLARLLGFVDTGATTTSISGGSAERNIDGGLILSPGTYCCFVSSAAGTASSFLGSFAWEEVPVGSL